MPITLLDTTDVQNTLKGVLNLEVGVYKEFEEAVSLSSDFSASAKATIARSFGTVPSSDYVIEKLVDTEWTVDTSFASQEATESFTTKFRIKFSVAHEDVAFTTTISDSTPEVKDTFTTTFSVLASTSFTASEKAIKSVQDFNSIQNIIKVYCKETAKTAQETATARKTYANNIGGFFVSEGIISSDDEKLFVNLAKIYTLKDAIRRYAVKKELTVQQTTDMIALIKYGLSGILDSIL